MTFALKLFKVCLLGFSVPSRLTGKEGERAFIPMTVSKISGQERRGGRAPGTLFWGLYTTIAQVAYFQDIAAGQSHVTHTSRL